MRNIQPTTPSLDLRITSDFLSELRNPGNAITLAKGVNNVFVDPGLGELVFLGSTEVNQLDVADGSHVHVVGTLTVDGTIAASGNISTSKSIRADYIYLGGSLYSGGDVIGVSGIETAGDLAARGSILSEDGAIACGERISALTGSVMAHGSIISGGAIFAAGAVTSMTGDVNSMEWICALDGVRAANDVLAALGISSGKGIHCGGLVRANLRILAGFTPAEMPDVSECGVDAGDVDGFVSLAERPETGIGRPLKKTRRANISQ